MFPQSGAGHSRVLVVVAIVSAVILLGQFGLPDARPIFSRWGVMALGAAQKPARLSGVAERVEPAAPPSPAALGSYNQGSALLERVAEGRVGLYRRDLPGGGTLIYAVTLLDEQTQLRVLTADGATPGSDASGDTIWLDGGRHLATAAEMATAPYAARDGMTLLGAMAFGFHGDARTADEGTVVIDGTIHRINPWRAALCITRERQALIGLFDAQALARCEQANGAGPVVLWQGKIANPAVSVPDGEFVPFNPLGENFVQLDWRKKVYSGLYPKTFVGVGPRPDGGSFVVFANSYGMAGIDVARELRAMGCADAIGGDDDTSTQLAWRGIPVVDRRVREVPTALAIYVRN